MTRILIRVMEKESYFGNFGKKDKIGKRSKREDWG